MGGKLAFVIAFERVALKVDEVYGIKLFENFFNKSN